MRTAHTELSIDVPAETGETLRLAALHELNILDTPAEPQFDRIVRLAAHILDMPISTIAFIDEARQWFKAKIGVDGENTPRSITFCTHTIEQDGIMVVEDATQDVRFAANPLVNSAPNIRFYAGAPLRLRSGHAVGAICVIDHVARTMSQEQRERLADLAAIAVDELELRRANYQLSELAVTDSLTGLMNRRAFTSSAEREIARAARYRSELAFLMLDIDHFKAINDTYGHETGDKAIAGLAAALSAEMRKEVLVCRLGGDEFAVALPETGEEAVGQIAERLRRRASALRVATQAGEVAFTVSIGAALYQPTDTLDAVLGRADQALYESKRGGRDRVSIL